MLRYMSANFKITAKLFVREQQQKMFNFNQSLKRLLPRHYTTKAKRSLLNQDKTKILEYKPNIGRSNMYRVYAWGFQETGALGLITDVKKAQQRYTEIVNYPTRMPFSTCNDVLDIAAGYGFSVFSVNQDDGETLFGTGLNTDSQLGFQTKGPANDPKTLDVIIYPIAITLPRLEGESNEEMQVKCMAAGRAHLVVVTKNGTIFTLGNNSYGQCGREIIEGENYRDSAIVHRIPQSSFCEIEDEVVSVVCGQDHTMFLTRLGRVYTCGWGADGQTGQGHFETSGFIEQAKGDIENEHIVKIACAADCVLALNDKGKVFGWGNTEYGQLNPLENAEPQINSPRALTITKGIGKIKDIAAGGSFCMALNEAGLVYTWGYGVLGFGPKVEQTSKPKNLLPPLFGRNDFSNETHVVSIGCGVFHMGAINSDGDLFMWGKNRFGHLGLGHKQDQFFPFKAAVNGKVIKTAYGVDHTLALCKPFV